MRISNLPSPMEIMLDPLSLIAIVIYLVLIVWEALFPARVLPAVKFWKTKGLLAFIFYFFLSSYFPLMWDSYFSSFQLVDLQHLSVPLQFVIGFLVYETLVYAWHRALHSSDFLWFGFHQMHHSAERLDTFGAFWLSPLDMIGFTLVGSVALVLGVGIDAQAATAVILVTFFFAIFQHMNINTPQWLGYFVQRPESHSQHHGMGVHHNNYADVPWFDMLFGTFVNPKHHSENGFYLGASDRVWEMLLGKDISETKSTITIEPVKEVTE